jgi:hypothetical protein
MNFEFNDFIYLLVISVKIIIYDAFYSLIFFIIPFNFVDYNFFSDYNSISQNKLYT